MPVICQHPLRPMGREEFGRVSYDVLKDVFAIHQQFGRLFEESFYQQHLARIRDDVWLEFGIDVSHDTFTRRYLCDVVVQAGGIFEFKAADAIVPRHRTQLLNYLMLAGLSHGMIVNVRPRRVEREYLNNALSCHERKHFDVIDQVWDSGIPSAGAFHQLITALVSDWGTGLELPLYEDALVHFFGGTDVVEQRIDVVSETAVLGTQRVRLAAPMVAFKLTAFDNSHGMDRFEVHAQKFVDNLALDALLWANIGRHEVAFRNVTRHRKR